MVVGWIVYHIIELFATIESRRDSYISWKIIETEADTEGDEGILYTQEWNQQLDSRLDCLSLLNFCVKNEALQNEQKA